MRKLLNKRGSVLFLVVVVMAILMVAAAATYYVVRNQRASANVHYSSEQSYQTAYSVSKAVSGFIDKSVRDIANGASIDGSNYKLIKEMLSLPEEGLISNVGEWIDLTELGMGNAKVTIQKVKSEDEAEEKDENKEKENDDDDEGEDNNIEYIFEITTTAEVNGETTSLVLRKKIETASAAGGDYFAKFLVSTGYIQEDTLVGSNTLFGDTYFENDYTVLGVGQMKVEYPVYCSGTLTDLGISYESINPVEEIVVNDNFYIESSSGSSLYAKKIYVGGDFYNGKSDLGNYTGKAMYVDEVYVLGDFHAYNADCESATIYVGGDCYIDQTGSSNATFYINGDLHIKNQPTNNGTFYVNGDVYLYFVCGQWVGDVKQTVKEIQYGGELKDTGYEFYDGVDYNGNKVWYNIHKVDSPSKFTETTISSTSEHISTSTRRNYYAPWNAEQYYLQTADPGGRNIIRLDDDTLDEVTRVDGSDNYIGGWRVRIDKSCTIVPAKNEPRKITYESEWYNETKESQAWYWGSNPKGNYIIIDASEEDIYIRLAPDIDENGKVVGDVFSFVPLTSYGEPDATPVNILIKGSHSVIFVLPEGVDFVMNYASFIGHYDMAMALTKQKGFGNMTEEEEEAFFSSVGTAIRNHLQDSTSVTNLINGFIITSDEGAKLDTAKINEAVGYTTSVHNNIFLVTTGENTLKFNPSGAFCGYLYGPKATLDASDPQNTGLAFLGGLIMGSYQYNCAQAVLKYLSPGDGVVNELISKAPGGGGGGDSSNSVLIVTSSVYH